MLTWDRPGSLPDLLAWPRKRSRRLTLRSRNKKWSDANWRSHIDVRQWRLKSRLCSQRFMPRKKNLDELLVMKKCVWAGTKSIAKPWLVGGALRTDQKRITIHEGNRAEDRPE